MRSFIMNAKFILLSAMSLLSFSLPAYEQAMDQTPKGEIEIKTVPAMTAIETQSDESYFDEDNGMFRKLFRYISQKDISMTTPVTVDVNPGAMRFIVGEKDLERADADTNDVKVVQLPERKVVSIGYNGRYNEKNYKLHLKQLRSWLEENADSWEANGEPIGVYWDGPFKLSNWKKAEVMIPVKAVETAEQREESAKPTE